MLHVVSWNANGVANKMGELTEYIRQERPDIMIISETKLQAQNKFKIQNYTIHRRDRPGPRGGGVAMLVKAGIPHAAPPPHDTGIEHVSIVLGDGTKVCGVYNAPRNRIREDDLRGLVVGGSVVVAGDLNARHTLWHCRRANRNGNTLQEFAEREGLAVLATDTPTHYPPNGMSPTYIDLLVVKNLDYPIEPQATDDLCSDHSPVHFWLRDPGRDATERRVFSYRTTNWRRFRQLVATSVQITTDIATPQRLDVEVERFRDVIVTARNRTTRLVTIRDRNEPLPEEILNLITFRNRIRKRWQRFRERADRVRIRELTETIKSRISEHKNRLWDQKIRSLGTADNSLWKMMRLLRRSSEPIPTIESGGRLHHRDSEKAEAIAHHLQRTFTTPEDDTEEQRQITLVANAAPLRTQIPRRDLAEYLATPGEVRDEIRHLPNGKAPGEDGLANIVLKNLPRKALVQLTYLVNAALRLHYFPRDWKRAVVLPFRKPGKPAQQPGSYRPIALLNTMGKLAERIILKRLNSVIDRRRLIPVSQCGFRKGSSTTHAVAKVVQDSLLAVNRQQSTAALLLDVAKAFDSVWHLGLIYKMSEVYRMPDHMVALIKSYLQDRCFKVKVGESYSSDMRATAGVPQGTVLSPVLYNLYVADLPTQSPACTLQYADDTIVYASSCHAQAAVDKIRYQVSRLEPYYKRWKIAINPEKTEHIVLTKKFTDTNVPRPIRLGGVAVQTRRKAKYLGVTLDRTLSFKPHVTATIQKLYSAVCKLYPLINRRSALDSTNKLLLYKTVLRPIITYACPAWCSISKTQMCRLQRQQNKLLRLLLNEGRYTAVEELHRRAELEPIEQHIAHRASNFFERKAPSNPLTENLADIRDADHWPHKHRLLHQGLPIYFRPRPERHRRPQP